MFGLAPIPRLEESVCRTKGQLKSRLCSTDAEPNAFSTNSNAFLHVMLHATLFRSFSSLSGCFKLSIICDELAVISMNAFFIQFYLARNWEQESNSLRELDYIFMTLQDLPASAFALLFHAWVKIHFRHLPPAASPLAQW